MSFDIEHATKLYKTHKNLETLTMRFPLIDPEWDDEEDIEDNADYAGVTVEEYITITENIDKAAKEAREAFNKYERQFDFEDLPVEYMKLTTSRFCFDESKAIDMAKEYL